MTPRFGLLLPGDELAVDFRTGWPATYAHASSARRARRTGMAAWLADLARVVRVDVDLATATFVVHR